MSEIRVNIIGGSNEHIDCDAGAITKLVKKDLFQGYGKGILKRDGKLVLSKTLTPGVYEYHLTSQQGQLLNLCCP
jgi:hypothetical protein